MNKFSLIATLLVATNAVQLEGIPYPALMQEQPSHWRKVWPEGATDNSDGDAEVIDKFNTRPPPKPDGP